MHIRVITRRCIYVYYSSHTYYIVKQKRSSSEGEVQSDVPAKCHISILAILYNDFN